MESYRKNSLIFVSLALLSSGINYLCQMMLGRLQSVEIFGVINSIFAFSIVIASPGTTLSMIMAKKTAILKESKGTIRILVIKLLKITMILIALTVPITLILKVYISKIIRTDDWLIILITLLFTTVGYLPVAFTGMLTGLNKYVFAGIISLFTPMFKLISIIISILLKQQGNYIVLTILLGLLLGGLVSSFIGIVIVNKEGYFNKENIKGIVKAEINFSREYMWMFMSNLSIVLLSNIDILMLNYFYKSEDVGLYSSVMLFGKIVFYVVTSLVTVMLAHIAELHGEEGKQKKILFDTCIYTLILSCICFIPLNIFSGFFIKVVFTTKYLKAEEYMLLTSLISLGLSFLSIFMNFMIAKNKQGLFVKVIAIALSLLLGVSKFFSKAPSHTLTIIVFTLLGTTVFCGIYCFGTKEQIRHNTKI